MSSYVRWWWFYGDIKPDTIARQLKWVKKQGFNGVEIAWMYQQDECQNPPQWLSPEWSKLVHYTKQQCQQLGLLCDYTYGSAWPFSLYGLTSKYRLKEFAHGQIIDSQQLVNGFWQEAGTQPPDTLNHLDHHAVHAYCQQMNKSLQISLDMSVRLFCDSWEINCDSIWTDHLDRLFFAQYGYDLRPLMSNIMCQYDYRKLVSRLIIEEFYEVFTKECHKMGVKSRVQCHGSPTDLLRAYSVVDVPETESLLYPPSFAMIASSAGALSQKRIISSETFTCLYGFKPAHHMKQEYYGDIKLLLDAMFANGVNAIVWHGMPYEGYQFYATTYIGPDSSLTPYLESFNQYINQLSNFMTKGYTYTDFAMYFPLEDAWIQGKYPNELRCPGAVNYYDFRYLKKPTCLQGYQPLWISTHFLQQSHYNPKTGLLQHHDCLFHSLYVESHWLDYETLECLLKLGHQGLPIYMVHVPQQAGTSKKHQFETLLQQLLILPNVFRQLNTLLTRPRLITFHCDQIYPFYWCRIDKTEAYIFLSHPLATDIVYPMRYHQSDCGTNMSYHVTIHLYERDYSTDVVFSPLQSILLHITANPPQIEQIILQEVGFAP